MEGRCLCEHIHFSVSDDAVTVVNCHCNLCRKMNGSAFSTYVVVNESEFELVSGALKQCRFQSMRRSIFASSAERLFTIKTPILLA